jgi:hypothetical protein
MTIFDTVYSRTYHDSFIGTSDPGYPGSVPFIMQVKTDNAGTSLTDQFTIPLGSAPAVYNFVWKTSDGTSGSHSSNSDLTLTFPSGAGTYLIYIYGEFPRIVFDNGGDRQKLIDVTQWGNIQWWNFNDAFFGCVNCAWSVTDIPDIRLVTNWTNAFRDTPFNQSNFSQWPFDKTKALNWTGLFQTSNTNILMPSGLKISNLLNTFRSNTGMTTANAAPVESYDMTSLTNAQSAYRFCNIDPDISAWQIPLLANCDNMFTSGSFTTPNFSSFLISAAAQATTTGIQNNVAFNAGPASWTVGAADTAKTLLEGAPYLWTFTSAAGPV